MLMHACSKHPIRLAALAQPQSYASAKAVLAAAGQWMRSSWLGKALSALMIERQARIAIDELRGWDDHMLRDIGLERMDIEGAVRGQFPPLPRGAEPAGNPPLPYFWEGSMRGHPFVSEIAPGRLHLSLRTLAANDNVPLAAMTPPRHARDDASARWPIIARSRAVIPTEAVAPLRDREAEGSRCAVARCLHPASRRRLAPVGMTSTVLALL